MKMSEKVRESKSVCGYENGVYSIVIACKGMIPMAFKQWSLVGLVGIFEKLMGGVKVTVPMSLFMVQNANCVKSENSEAPNRVGFLQIGKLRILVFSRTSTFSCLRLILDHGFGEGFTEIPLALNKREIYGQHFLRPTLFVYDKCRLSYFFVALFPVFHLLKFLFFH